MGAFANLVIKTENLDVDSNGTPSTPSISTFVRTATSTRSIGSKWRASKETEGAVLRVVHGLGHVNRGTALTYSPAARQDRLLARSAATPSRLRLRTPKSAPSATSPGKPRFSLKAVAMAAMSANKMSQALACNPKRHSKAMVSLLARRDVYVRSEEIRAQAEQEFRERDGGAAGGGGGEGASVAQRGGLKECSDSGDEHASSDADSPPRRFDAASGLCSRHDSIVQSRGFSSGGQSLPASQDATRHPPASDGSRVHSSSTGSRSRLHQSAGSNLAAKLQFPYLDEGGPSVQEWGGDPIPIGSRQLASTTTRSLRAGTGNSFRFRGPNALPSSSFRVNTVLKGKVAALALKGLDNADTWNQLSQRQVEVLGRSYSAPVGTPPQEVTSFLEGRYPQAKVMCMYVDQAALRDSEGEWVPARKRIHNIEVAERSLRCFTSEGTNIPKRIQTFFDNIQDVRTCRPFLVPPTPEALRTEKLAVVAPIETAEQDPDLPAEWEDILDRVADLIPIKHQRSELRMLRRLIFRWMTVLKRMYHYYASRWNMHNVPEGFMWQAHMRFLVQDCFLSCRQFPMAQIDRILGPCFETEYELHPETSSGSLIDNDPTAMPKFARIRRSSVGHPSLIAEEVQASLAARGVRRHSAVGVAASGVQLLAQPASPGPGSTAEGAPHASPGLVPRGGRRRASMRVGVGVDEDENFTASRDLPCSPGPTLDGEVLYQAEMLLHRRDRGPIVDATYLTEALIRIAHHRPTIPASLKDARPTSSISCKTDEVRPSTAPAQMPAPLASPAQSRAVTAPSSRRAPPTPAPPPRAKSPAKSKRGRKGKKSKKEAKPPPPVPLPARRPEVGPLVNVPRYEDRADMTGGALVYGRLKLAPVPAARIDQLRQMVQKQWKENKERRERPPPKEKRKKNTDAMQSNKPGARKAAASPRVLPSSPNRSRPITPSRKPASGRSRSSQSARTATTVKPVETPLVEEQHSPVKVVDTPFVGLGERFKNMMLYAVMPNACREWDAKMRMVWCKETQCVLEAYKRPLFKIWQYFHDRKKRNFQPTMTSNAWLHMLQRLNLLDHKLTIKHCYQIYESITGEYGRLQEPHSTNEDTEIIFSEWMDMLAFVALVKKKQSLASGKAVKEFLEEVLLPVCKEILPFRLDTSNGIEEGVGSHDEKDFSMMMAMYGHVVDIVPPPRGGEQLGASDHQKPTTEVTGISW